MKERCHDCGRIVGYDRGMWTSWGGKYPGGGIFLCNRCMRRREKEEAQVKLEKYEEIAEWAKSLSSVQERENKAIVQALRDLCKVDGWYRLMDITHSFNKQTGWDYDVRVISKILSRLGFRDRRRMGGGYTNVWISLAILEKISRRLLNLLSY